MTNNCRIRGILVGAAILLSVAVDGQRAAVAKLDSITRTGFYRIVLPPRLVAQCQSDLSDLRVIKSDGSEVPYVLRTDSNDLLNAGYLALPDPTIRRKDSSNKHSYYRLQYDDAYRIDRLSLIISNPILYKRAVRVVAGKDSLDDMPSGFFSIDPHDTVLRLAAVKARVLIIDINNGDNPPLDITRAASAQTGLYILTYLQAFAGSAYALKTGDTIDGPPDYDLHYFTDSLRGQPFDIGLQPMRPGEIAENLRANAIRNKTAMDDKNGDMGSNRKSGFILWSILIIILLLLIYVSIRLARAISKKDN